MERTNIGSSVQSVFENLLPDRDNIRRRIAERVGAEGIDSYGLLSKIGRDCVGALQFLPEDQATDQVQVIEGENVSRGDIEGVLANLVRAPLGLDAEDEFRISIAGAQEKTALLWHENRWKKPLGTTPTTHILKPLIGTIENSTGTIDLSNSVENEYYCLKRLRYGKRMSWRIVQQDSVPGDVREEWPPSGQLIVHVVQAVHNEVHRRLDMLSDRQFLDEMLIGLVPVGMQVGEVLPL